MYKIFLFFFLVSLIGSGVIYGQAKGSVRVGERVPDVSFSFYRGDTSFETHLYSFKQNLILFDFWGVHCNDCISSMPQMMTLEREFRDKIKIFIVTSDTKETIDGFLLKLRKSKTVPNELIEAFGSLSFITKDSIFRRLFIHETNPAHVWIGKEYVYRALAYDNSTNYSNIKSFLSGGDVKWWIMKPNIGSASDPLFDIRRRMDGISNNTVYSILTPHLELGRGTSSDIKGLFDSDSGKEIGVTAVNACIRDLYQFAFGDEIADLDRRRILVTGEVRDKIFFSHEDSTDEFEWYMRNTYCYTIRTNSGSDSACRLLMRHDLDRLFNLNSSIEYRNVNCFVLKRVSSDDDFAEFGTDKLKYRKRALDSLIANSDFKEFNDAYSVYSVLRALFYYRYPNMPFFCNGPFGKIDKCIIPWSYKIEDISIEGLKLALRLQGFDLQEQYRTIPMVVIKNAANLKF